MQGDLDNIIKLVLDAMSRLIYVDDRQVERIVVQKFEPGRPFSFRDPSAVLAEALEGSRPVLYIRVSSSLAEDLA